MSNIAETQHGLKVLQDQGAQLDESLRLALTFGGFDHNDRLESQMSDYVRFLVRGGRWTEQKGFVLGPDRGNSHLQMTSTYSRMLTGYREAKQQVIPKSMRVGYALTEDQLRHIAAARVHHRTDSRHTSRGSAHEAPVAHVDPKRGAQARADAAGVIVVLCGEVELQEYGEVVAVGDRVRRRAGRRSGVVFGGELDEVEWSFDRYVEYTRAGQAEISGTVVEIEAVFVRLTRDPDGAWAPRRGSARREAVAFSASTSRMDPEIEWNSPSDLARDGWSSRRGHRVVREGDEQFSGWLLRLADEQVLPVQ